MIINIILNFWSIVLSLNLKELFIFIISIGSIILTIIRLNISIVTHLPILFNLAVLFHEYLIVGDNGIPFVFGRRGAMAVVGIGVLVVWLEVFVRESVLDKRGRESEEVVDLSVQVVFPLSKGERRGELMLGSVTDEHGLSNVGDQFLLGGEALGTFFKRQRHWVF